jgi:hypothetical protein
VALSNGNLRLLVDMVNLDASLPLNIHPPPCRPSTHIFHGMPCSRQSCSIHTNRKVSKLEPMRRHNVYTSNPLAYQSVARFLGVPPQKCAMVAAHLFDLRGAKGCDYKTV